ncbi:MAG TPA: histidine kinase [Bacteroidota bacterium]|nr:histidine kinase [Bacteroidota bacterium]
MDGKMMPGVASKDDHGQPWVVTDGSFEILEMGGGFGKLIGYADSEVAGKVISEFLHSEDRGTIEGLRVSLGSGGQALRSVRMKTKSGFTLRVRIEAKAIDPHRFKLMVCDADDGGQPGSGVRSQYALALYEIGRQMTSSFDAAEVLKLIVKNVAWLLECQFVAVAEVDVERGLLTYSEVVGNKADHPSGGAGKVGRGIAGRVTLTQKPFIMERLPGGEDSSEFELMICEYLQSAFGVPITNKGHQFGALVVGYRNDHRITEEEVQLTTNLANQAALALDNAALYRQSVEHSKSMAALSSRIALVQEEERRRITRELHDGIGQLLTGLRMNLELLLRQLPAQNTDAAERIAVMKQVIDETNNTIRRIAFDLRPPILDDLGLVPALRFYVDRFQERTNIRLALLSPDHLKRFDPKMEATLYRVVQEALTNVAKHSGAKNASIEIASVGEQLRLRISDDGHGFETRQAGEGGLWSNGLGIVNMKERVGALHGRFALRTEKGKGTVISIEVPVHDR